MKWISTRNRKIRATFLEAICRGLAPDGGLYVPESFPKVSKEEFQEFSDLPFAEVASRLAQKWLKGEFPREKIKSLAKKAFDFPIVLRPIDESLSVLELFHGPSFSFKDFGARFLAQGLKFSKAKRRIVLTATSGDTGSAVAHAFFKDRATSVVILYPSKKISSLQEKQMTTLGNNITALEIDGTFDDCQRLVKTAFQDRSLQSLHLTSANSINAGRLLPQSFYYFFAASRLKGRLCFVVPSGNLGNLTGGVLAKKTGCPIERFIAATNRNDPMGFIRKAGERKAKSVILTLSNAMDVAHPSNMERLQFLFHKKKEMRETVCPALITDPETKNTIRRVWREHNYLIDPHTAVGWKAYEKLRRPGTQYILLATAHPAKFPEAVREATGANPSMPPSLKVAMEKEKESVKLPKDYATLVNWLKRFQRG